MDPFFPSPSNHQSQNLSSGDLASTSSCMEYQASLLLCIPGNQIIVIELMSTHAQFFTSSTTKKWQQALKPMSLTHEVTSPVYFRLAFDQLILIAVPITTDYCC
jgi:hypothetical protein